MSDLNDFSSKLLKAIAHPTRLQILKLLRDENELTVFKIYESLNLEQSNISQHLSLLKNSGILSSRKEGSRVYYKIEYMEIYTIIQLSEKIVITEYEKKYSNLSSEEN